jgi:hypothetical protein
MPSADDIARTIEPGSLPQGERQVVAANLQDALGGQGLGAEAPAAIPDAPEEAVDPIERLLSGEHSSDLPITAGLPVGPGSSGAVANVDSPRIVKLRQLAMHAKSPHIRHSARTLLKRELRAT